MITLTTDFGYKDPFVGMMKGVILSINPDVQIVDITHGISPYNIMEAAVVIGESYKYFPPKSIHVVVVDPGVGSARRPILIETAEHIFVGPDNGVFTEIFNSYSSFQVLHITADYYFLHKQSSTFHGRDVFAPVAAWLSRGIRAINFGEPITDYVKLELPVPSIESNRISGEVIFLDRFGNAITNIKAEHLQATLQKDTLRVLVKDRHIDIKSHYSEADDNEPHALINSSGHLEIFVYMRSASETLGINVGDPVSVTA